ncbi:hypothetical protein JTB14_026383 [Gonioctena quinquepunctata]|nr:hypothetical protein JTB14_026383 [Gonioctena quinquepunctata]
MNNNKNSWYQVIPTIIIICDFTQKNEIRNVNNRILDLILSPGDVDCNVSLDNDPLVVIDPHHPALIINTPLLPNEQEVFLSKEKRLDFKKLILKNSLVYSMR